MSASGLSKEQIVKLFVLSLSSPAVISWYHDLDRSVQQDWKELSDHFVKEFSYNTELEVTLRDLETTRQKPNESFADYIRRWRKKAALMKRRPDMKDQIRIILKGALPMIADKLCFVPIHTFEELYESGIQVEEMSRDKGRFEPSRRPFGRANFNEGNGDIQANVKEVNATTPQPTNSYQPPSQSRQFSNFGKPMSRILEKLMEKNLLQPLLPPPLSKPLGSHIDEYCTFHQRLGHHTDHCGRLRKEIQDLIDNDKIPDPSHNRQTTQTNPLPNYQAMPPPNQDQNLFMIIGEDKNKELHGSGRQVEEAEGWLKRKPFESSINNHPEDESLLEHVISNAESLLDFF